MEASIYNPLFVPSYLEKSMVDHLTVIVACVFVAVFLGATVALGFPLNQLVDEVDEIIFLVSNSAHNPFYLIYLSTAIGFIFLALLSEKILVQSMRLISKIYILTGLVGFLIFGPQTNGLLVSIINLGLGFFIVAVGWLLQEYRQWLIVERIIAKRRERLVVP